MTDDKPDRHYPPLEEVSTTISGAGHSALNLVSEGHGVDVTVEPVRASGVGVDVTIQFSVAAGTASVSLTEDNAHKLIDAITDSLQVEKFDDE